MGARREDWITSRRLDRVQVDLHFIDGAIGNVVIVGWGESKRSSLWRDELVPELYESTEDVLGRLQHDLDVIGRLQPVTSEQLDQLLRYGTMWEQPQLDL
jgi:hypothetical protein